MDDETLIIACDDAVTPKKVLGKQIYLAQLWRNDLYPDDYVLCKIGFNLAKKCRELHLKGLIVANEWNENNVRLDTINHEVAITSFYTMDTIKGTLLGTDGYLAPEYYKDHKYDQYSDYFGIAVFLYRLFIGGYPLDGKKTAEYCVDKQMLIGEAAPVIYGSEALFAFDPYNQQNSIRDYVDALNPKLYEIQTKRWDALDERIKKCFIKTFSDGLKAENKMKRTSTSEWMQTFKAVAQNGMRTCPNCQRRLFIGRTVCPWCK